MNIQGHKFPTDSDWRRRVEIFRYLEDIGRDLDLTEDQVRKAQQEHKNLCDWLASSINPLLLDIFVYMHGSFALGTALKPLARTEFDIDMICLMRDGHAGHDPARIKELIGKRLAENPAYAGILEEKKRCWRINFPGDFHIDIACTVPNPQCDNNGELIPDKALEEWHPTNPQGYKALFDQRAAMAPRYKRSFLSLSDSEALAAEIEPFPENTKTRGVLRRLVQLLRRHRDFHFIDVQEDVAPISIIITTLAMRSYEHCVQWYTFDDELEFFVEVVRMMPHFIEVGSADGQKTYAVWNETTTDENFADRWNTEPKRVRAFYTWHEKALTDFETIRDAIGLDEVITRSRRQFGQNVVDRVVTTRNNAIAEARKSKRLLVAPTIGLTTVSGITGATAVPKNDFFGDEVDRT